MVTPTKNATVKVVAATTGSAFGGAVGSLFVYLINKASPGFFDPSISGAVVTIVATIVAFVAGYYKAPSSSEAVISDGSGNAVTATNSDVGP